MVFNWLNGLFKDSSKRNKKFTPAESSQMVKEDGHQKTEQPTVMASEIIKLSDDIQLTVKGLPSELPPEKRNAILESLVRNTLSRLPQRGYEKGENIYRGQASLKLNEQTYDIIFSLDAIRVLTALQIYKEAFDVINEGAKEGTYDLELAELAADYIKQSAWDEVQSAIHPNQPHEAHNQNPQNRAFERPD
jgi:plasmid maintenance system killer protein